MDTVRVNICYRSLRICWASCAGALAIFRKAVNLSYTMWGGRFNPIAIVDRPEEAHRIVEVVRADMIVPVGANDALEAFKKRFSHLISPFFPDRLFLATKGYCIVVGHNPPSVLCIFAWQSFRFSAIGNFHILTVPRHHGNPTHPKNSLPDCRAFRRTIAPSQRGQ